MAKYKTDDKGNVILVDDNHCGPICQVKNRVKNVKLGIQGYQQKQQKKKLDRLGFSNMAEFKKAKAEAQAKGRQSAQVENAKAKMQQIQQDAYHKAGGKVGKPKSFFDSFMNPKPQARTVKRSRRKVKPQFQVHGGKLYQVQQPKATKRKNLTKRTKKGNGVKKVANFFGASNGPTKRSKKSNKDPFGINSTNWSFGL